MSNTTDTNQASEDELMGELRLLYGRRISSNLSLAEYMQETRQLIQKLIRTEKLKLLAEVREQTTIFKIKAHDKKGQPHLYEAGRGVPPEVLDKLEAEL